MYLNNTVYGFINICLPRYFHLLAQSIDRFEFLTLLVPENNTISALKHETPSAGSEWTFVTSEQNLRLFTVVAHEQVHCGKVTDHQSFTSPSPLSVAWWEINGAVFAFCLLFLKFLILILQECVLIRGHTLRRSLIRVLHSDSQGHSNLLGFVGPALALANAGVILELVICWGIEFPASLGDIIRGMRLLAISVSTLSTCPCISGSAIRASQSQMTQRH